MDALTPEPLKLMVTVPGGTPVSVNCPRPSTSVEMLVPAMLTRSEVPARGAMTSVLAAVAAVRLLPLTRPVITAPLEEPPRPEGPVGVSDDDESLQAVPAIMQTIPR